MSRCLDVVLSLLEQLEARGGREGAVLAGEFYADVGAALSLFPSPSLFILVYMSAPSTLRALEGKVHGGLGRATRSLRSLRPGLAPVPFGLLGWVNAAGGGSLTPVVRRGRG